LRSIIAILFSLMLLFPSIGFSMVIDACCITDYETCCSQDFNSASCHSTVDPDDCDDVVLIVLPLNQIDFTSHKSLDIPSSLPILLKVKVYPKPNPYNGLRIINSTYYDTSNHPSIFQVFLC